MNTVDHFKETSKNFDKRIALLSTLPDVFVVLRKIAPDGPFRRWCLEMHNTEEAIRRVSNISPLLGTAWREHMRQDIETHQFRYNYRDSVPKGSVLLLSGGLDSFIYWRLLGQPLAVHYNIDNRASQREQEKIELIRHDFSEDIINDDNLRFLGRYEYDNGYIPYRNLFFILMASLISEDIILSQIAEWAPDKNRIFYKHTERLLKEIGTGAFQNINLSPRICTPFAYMTKTELVREYLKHWKADDLKKYTVSCYSDSTKPCGQCTACISRHIAFTNNNIEPEEYLTQPDIEKFTSKFSIKDFRFSNISMYIKRWKEFNEYKRNCLLRT